MQNTNIAFNTLLNKSQDEGSIVSSHNNEAKEVIPSIVHELKTPLNAIVGFAEILEDEINGVKMVIEAKNELGVNNGSADKTNANNSNNSSISVENCINYAQEIKTASLELLEIVHDLLDVNVNKFGSFSADLSQKIDITEVIRRSIRLNWDYSLRRNIAINLELQGVAVLTKSFIRNKVSQTESKTVQSLSKLQLTQNVEMIRNRIFGIPTSQNKDKNFSDIAIPLLNLDQKRMKQILTNLISNAIKYSPDKTKIEVSARLISDDNYEYKEITTDVSQLPADEIDIISPTTNQKSQTTNQTHTTKKPVSSQNILEIIVADQGFGMTPEQISQIFDPYTTFQNPNSGSVSSHGLGLSIVKKLVEAQNGQILVKSEPGKGSKFTLRFAV